MSMGIVLKLESYTTRTPILYRFPEMRLIFVLFLFIVAFDIHFVQAFIWKSNERLDEPITMLRDLRAKEISPPSYMKRFENEPNEQLLRYILNPKMSRRYDLLKALFYQHL
ncbi:Zinc finger CCCH-type antiviral protein [Dirofilaria immitis]|nr:hypothetical protein [Dirofilaria immitis]